MKRCPYCGKELPEEMQFCPYCMKKLIGEQSVAGVSANKQPLGWPVIVGGIAVFAAVCALVIGLLSGSPQDAPAGGTTATTSGLRAQVTANDATEAVNGTVGGSSSAEVGSTTAETGGETTKSQNGAGSGSTTTTKRNTTTKKGDTTTTTGKTTTTKGATTATKKGTSVQSTAADPCAVGHSWQAITETVEHDEVGHYEQVVTGSKTVTTYKCAVCYDTFESLSAYYTHFEEHENSSDALVVIFRERYETDTKQVPVYGQQWVVDKAAYSEQVIVGHKCSVCGAEQ